MYLPKLTLTLVLLFITAANNTILGQCKTLDSSFFTFSSSTITITSFPGFSWTPRIKSSSISTPLYSVGRSSDAKISSSSTNIYSSAPSKTNVYFGGEDNTNGHANSQVISTKSYDLYAGNLTIIGTFFNRSGDPLYNESYVGIVPFNYKYYSPLDNDISSNEGREGIVAGSVATSKVGLIINHNPVNQGSLTLKGPTSINTNYSKWYTIEINLQIKNERLILNKCIYSDGTNTAQPWGTGIDLGPIENFSWLDSAVPVWGVDDMLGNVSVIQRSCIPKKCSIQDSSFYDISKQNITRWQTPAHIDSIKSIDFSKVSTPLVIESIASNDSFFANSDDCFTPSNARNLVYFGGDLPTTNATKPSCLKTKSTYNIFEGPITITVDFFNRNKNMLYDESYISLTPNKYNWYNGWMKNNPTLFEGIRIGGIPGTTSIIDGGTGTQNDIVVKSYNNHNKSAVGRWYKMRITLDTLDGYFRLFECSIDSGNGFIKINKSPVHIGLTANFKWLNDCRVEALTDDMIDDFEIIKSNCLSKCIYKSFDGKICRQSDSFSIINNVLIDGKVLQLNSAEFLYGSNNKSNPEPKYGLKINNAKISGNLEPGIYNIRFISKNCNINDSFKIEILESPVMKQKDMQLFCSDFGSVLIDSFVESKSPEGGVLSWTGFGTDNNKLNIIESTGIYSPIYPLRLTYKLSNGCEDTSTSFYKIRNKPSISIYTSDTTICENDTIDLKTTGFNYNTIEWQKESTSNGYFSNASNPNTRFILGSTDILNKYVKLFAKTLPVVDDVCKTAIDSVLIKINSIPVIGTIDSSAGCIPHEYKLVGNELSGMPENQLRYNWDISNGNSHTGKNAEGTILAQGKYNVKLTITNNNTGCYASRSRNACILAYPKPFANFTSIPNLSASIENPKFELQNGSSIDQSIFKSNLKYSWTFKNHKLSENSELTNPTFTAPNTDTGIYKATLIAISDFGCADTTSKILIVFSEFKVHMPTAFAPEGINSKYRPMGEFYTALEWKIYDRWGAKLYESTSSTDGWDGKYMGELCPDGVYVCIATFKDVQGYKHQYKATFHLLR